MANDLLKIKKIIQFPTPPLTKLNIFRIKEKKTR